MEKFIYENNKYIIKKEEEKFIAYKKEEEKEKEKKLKEFTSKGEAQIYIDAKLYDDLEDSILEVIDEILFEFEDVQENIRVLAHNFQNFNHLDYWYIEEKIEEIIKMEVAQILDNSKLSEFYKLGDKLGEMIWDSLSASFDDYDEVSIEIEKYIEDLR